MRCQWFPILLYGLLSLIYQFERQQRKGSLFPLPGLDHAKAVLKVKLSWAGAVVAGVVSGVGLYNWIAFHPQLLNNGVKQDTPQSLPLVFWFNVKARYHHPIWIWRGNMIRVFSNSLKQVRGRKLSVPGGFSLRIENHPGAANYFYGFREPIPLYQAYCFCLFLWLPVLVQAKTLGSFPVDALCTG